MSKTKSEISTSIIGTIVSKRPDVRTNVGTVTNDVAINPTATELETAYTELDTTSKGMSLVYADDMTTEQLDNLASDVGLTRLTGVASAGSVVFQATSLLNNITIPLGTTVATPQPTTVTFTTAQTGIMIAASKTAYFNNITGKYEITIPVVCTESGIVGNVDAGAVDRIQGYVAGITSVTNIVAFTSGVDTETNTQLATRIVAKQSGNNYGTYNGYVSTVLAVN